MIRGDHWSPLIYLYIYNDNYLMKTNFPFAVLSLVLKI